MNGILGSLKGPYFCFVASTFSMNFSILIKSKHLPGGSGDSWGAISIPLAEHYVWTGPLLSLGFNVLQEDLPKIR